MDKPLLFCVSLKDESKKEELILKLRGIDSGLEYISERTGVLTFRTNKERYERIFRTKLEQNESDRRKYYYSPEGYRELKKACIPDGLAELIRTIFLKKNRDFGDLPYNPPYSPPSEGFEYD